MSLPNLGQISASTRVALPGLKPSLKLKLPKTLTRNPARAAGSDLPRGLSPRHARSALLGAMRP